MLIQSGIKSKVRSSTKTIQPMPLEAEEDETEESDRKVVERVLKVAEKHGVSRAQIALAWLLQTDPVTSPITGSTKTPHLEDAAAALSIKLTAEEIAYLEEPYVPHPAVGLA